MAVSRAKHWTRVRRMLVGWTFLASVLVTSGDLGSVDTLRRLQVTHSLWTSAPEVLPEDYPEFGISGPDGRLHAWYGIGQSLLMLPADVVGTALVTAAGLDGRAAERARVSFVNYATFPLISALGVLALWNLLVLLRFRARHATLGAVAFFLGTSFLAYSQAAFENTQNLALTLVALAQGLAWVRNRRPGHLWLAFLALGFNLLIKITYAVDYVVISGLLGLALGAGKGGRVRARFRERVVPLVGTAAVCGLAFTGMDRLYHHHRFGSWTSNYIDIFGSTFRSQHPEVGPGYPYATSVLDGVGGLLVGYRSVLVHDPLILLAVVLVALGGSRVPQLVKACVLAGLGWLVVMTVIAARFVFWEGGGCWGARYVLTPALFLAAFGVPLAARLWPRIPAAGRRLIAAVVGLAVVIQVGSLVFWYEVESVQRSSLGMMAPFPWLRWVNILAWLTDNLETWGRLAPGLNERHFTPNVGPLLAARRLSPAAGWAVRTVWFLLLLGVAAGLAFLVREARRVGGGRATPRAR